jgi:hypothetical protein
MLEVAGAERDMSQTISEGTMTKFSICHISAETTDGYSDAQIAEFNTRLDEVLDRTGYDPDSFDDLDHIQAVVERELESYDTMLRLSPPSCSRPHR